MILKYVILTIVECMLLENINNWKVFNNNQIGYLQLCWNVEVNISFLENIAIKKYDTFNLNSEISLYWKLSLKYYSYNIWHLNNISQRYSQLNDCNVSELMKYNTLKCVSITWSWKILKVKRARYVNEIVLGLNSLNRSFNCNWKQKLLHKTVIKIEADTKELLSFSVI